MHIVTHDFPDQWFGGDPRNNVYLIVLCYPWLGPPLRPSKGPAPSLAALKCMVAIRCINATAGLGGLWTLDLLELFWDA